MFVNLHSRVTKTITKSDKNNVIAVKYSHHLLRLFLGGENFVFDLDDTALRRRIAWKLLSNETDFTSVNKYRSNMKRFLRVHNFRPLFAYSLKGSTLLSN
jgi:hypothetical protein